MEARNFINNSVPEVFDSSFNGKIFDDLAFVWVNGRDDVRHKSLELWYGRKILLHRPVGAEDSPEQRGGEKEKNEEKGFK